MFSIAISHILAVTVFPLYQHITSLKLGPSSMNRDSKAFSYTINMHRENGRQGKSKTHLAYTS